MRTLVNLPDIAETVEIDLPCLIPYETFHAIHAQGPAQFQKSVIGGDGDLAEFWNCALREEWAQKHPTVACFDSSCLVGLTWHLDGGEVHRNSEFYFFNVGTLHAQAFRSHSLDARFLVLGIPHLVMKLPGVKKQAMKLMADFAAWNHKVWKTKVMPERGFYDEVFPRNSLRWKMRGQPITGEYVGVFVGNMSDGKARVSCVP